MLRYHIRLLFLFEFLFIFIKSVKSLTVSHTVLIEANYYGDQDKISDAFADFTQFTIYRINQTLIYHKIQSVTPTFKLIWDEGNQISLECVGIKCTKIKLQNHEFKRFDMDVFIANLGGVFSYLLLLYGLFCLRKGIVYFNLTVIFYCSFGFILFVREVCQLLELIGKLNTEAEESQRIKEASFYFALFSSFLYGAVCHFSKYLKYVTFGLINGLFFSKIIYLLLISVLTGKFLLVYFLLELFFCLALIILFIFLQTKYIRISILYIVFIAGYGIIYAFNILFGGLPFFPFLILSKEYKEQEKGFYDKLMEKSHAFLYGIFYVVLVAFGYYENNINYKIATHKTLKKN